MLDPHIGPIMPISRLRNICQQVVAIDPDLILLTGDFFTLEAHGPPKDALRKALEPLSKVAYKTFACLGVVLIRFRY